MARQVIDLTTPQPNGRMGEPTKSAWEKVNDMTAELYPLTEGALQKTGGNVTGTIESSARILAAGSGAPNVGSGAAGYGVHSVGTSYGGGYRNADTSANLSWGWWIESTGCVFGQGTFTSNVHVMKMMIGNSGQVSAVSFNPTSTADVKDYIEGYVGDACEAIDKLVVISYKYRPEYIESDKTFIGLLEENVKSVVPDAANDSSIVVDDVEGEEVERLLPGNIDMMQILALSIRSHQQKNQKIKELEYKLANINDRMDAAGI